MDPLNLLILLLVLGPILVLALWSWLTATEAVEELCGLEPATQVPAERDGAR
jgi:hypothetical protein